MTLFQTCVYIITSQSQNHKTLCVSQQSRQVGSAAAVEEAAVYDWFAFIAVAFIVRAIRAIMVAPCNHVLAPEVA